MAARNDPPLEDRCNTLGRIDPIFEDRPGDFPLINFLPDRENAQNSSGFKVLSLLRREAKKYNELCFGLDRAIRSVKQYKDANILNLQSDNPLRLSTFSETN